jgi:hypothetical protein
MWGGIGVAISGIGTAIKASKTGVNTVKVSENVYGESTLESGNSSLTGNITFEEALQILEESGLRPGQTLISRSRVMEIVENYNPLKATSSVYSDATGRYLVEGHHTTVATTILGKGSALNMNIPTNQMPSVKNIHWTKKWWEIGKKAIKEID